MAIAHAKVTSKGQITIPRSVRKTLGLRTGSRVAFRTSGRQQVHMQPETISVQALKGMCRRPRQRIISVADMQRAIRQRHSVKRHAS